MQFVSICQPCQDGNYTGARWILTAPGSLQRIKGICCYVEDARFFSSFQRTNQASCLYVWGKFSLDIFCKLACDLTKKVYYTGMFHNQRQFIVAKIHSIAFSQNTCLLWDDKKRLSKLLKFHFPRPMVRGPCRFWILGWSPEIQQYLAIGQMSESFRVSKE